ncbi:MAG: hypothetical protein HN576_06080 [Bacteriovoracaceae bacterium]|nr:hypothetical protein [Bacteriovoracaceae bacterium]
MTKTISRITLFLLICLASFQVFSFELKIEKNPLFKILITESNNPGTHLNIYAESENYRFDLSLFDIVDTVSLILDKGQFNHYRNELNNAYRDDAIYFFEWFKTLKKIAKNDKDFEKKLNKKLYLQLYNKNSLAIIPEYKIIDFQKIKDLKILHRIKKYNSIINSAEGIGLADAYSMLSSKPFITHKLTVTKFKEISKRISNKIKKAYYRVYLKLIRKQYKNDVKKYGNHQSDVRFRIRRSGEIYASTSRSKVNKKIVKVFNLIQRLPQKQLLLKFVKDELAKQSIIVPVVQGHIVMTPEFIRINWFQIQKMLKEYTYENIINLKDDNYLLLVRKWIKRNKTKIKKDLLNYNLDNETHYKLEFRKKSLPRRLSVLKQYYILEKVYPNRPWMKKNNPDLIDSRGRSHYFSDSFIKKVGRKFVNIFKYLIKVENYVGLLTGTALMIASGGNVSISMATNSLIRKMIYNLKHDKEWREFIRSAPMDVLSAFLLGSGFTAGRLYRILALGSAQGALQSLLTGQDVGTGAIVGAGLNLVRYYILPYSIARPMTSGFDSLSLARNRLYEIIGTTVNGSIQGAVVAGFTGEGILNGAIRGGVYGTISSALTIWILGTRYHPFKEYTDQELDEMIAAENNFQNDVGRGGLYSIDRQLILDSNFRVGGVLPDAISASITLPGNVSMSDIGFNRLTTLTHEAQHLMQQSQSGVFGFYLFRYIPTALSTSYSGHPDEKFLGSFLSDYIATN